MIARLNDKIIVEKCQLKAQQYGLETGASVIIDQLHNERKGLKGGAFVYTRKQACDHMTGTRMTG